MYKRKLNPKFWGFVTGLMAIIYIYPRIIVGLFGEDDPWTSYFYMYGYGLITFALGMLIVMKSGALKPGRGNETLWFRFLLGGFVFFSTLHGLWIIMSLHIPFRGGVQ